jgi:hypothetical protein
MAMSLTGGNSKASFYNLDTSAAAFDVQYNPKEFRVEKSLTWEEAKTQGKSTNPIQFQKGAPMTASFDLMFDTTMDGANVQKVWVEKLLALTNANVEPAQGEPKELKKQRPPALKFTWGTFEMKCVIESVNVTYLMFTSEGTAVRARCSVKLKQWELAEFAGSGSSSRASDAKIKLVDVKGGQTLSQVAAAAGSDTRTVAAANGITDPMSDLTGQVLTIPAKSAASSVTSAAASAVEKAAKAAASNAANAAVQAVLSGNASNAGKAAASAAKSSATKAVTGAASKAAQDALKKLF